MRHVSYKGHLDFPLRFSRSIRYTVFREAGAVKGAPPSPKPLGGGRDASRVIEGIFSATIRHTVVREAGAVKGPFALLHPGNMVPKS